MVAYRQTPEEISGMPKGVPYIVGNELAERFSFYGMKTILIIFMTHHLKNATGGIEPMSSAEAMEWYHRFSASAYFFPILGAIVSDGFIGKYRTIMALSIVYCFGHLALAIDETRLGLLIGLTLIAVGSGGIKPCVSAHVGDQFGVKNQHLLERVFGWFYFSINFGSFFSTLLTPVLLEKYGPGVAFGLPGVFMALATVVFWLGRNRFAHIPPAGVGFVREIFSQTGLAVLARVIGLVLFISMFWALYDQNGSAWVLQAQRMDLVFLGITWLPSQVQAINPILVLILIPLMSYVVYPQVSRLWELTPLRKIGIGFGLTVLTFVISAHIEARLDAGEKVNIGWQLFAFAVLTTAEVLVYGTGLEFFYAQAPNRLKSFVMALFLFSVSLGNLFTSLVNAWLQNEDGSTKLTGPEYYLFFAGLMAVTTLLYVFYAIKYRGQRYVQGVEPAGAVPVG